MPPVDQRAEAEKYWADKGVTLAPQSELERAWYEDTATWRAGNPDAAAFLDSCKAETREEFWARREAAGTTFGIVPNPPFKRKRGPSKEVLALRAEIANLRARLAEWEVAA